MGGDYLFSRHIPNVALTFRKDTLRREFDTVQTIYGKVTVKRSWFNEKEVSCKPEYGECKRIAEEKGIPLKEVYNKIMGSIVSS